jgi:hypothetical protein
MGGWWTGQGRDNCETRHKKKEIIDYDYYL